MIAAGNLFTSCIQQLEPTGIQEMREAKAAYYEALAGLKNADAAKVLAEAEVEKAKAAVVNAKAAQEQAKAKILELMAEAKAMDNEQKAAEVAAEIAEIKATAEYDAVIAEQNLATAQDNLRKALANIAAEAQQLTTKEQEVVNAYYTAYDWFITKQKAVFDAEKDLWLAANEESSNPMNMDKKKAKYEKQIADAQKVIADREATIEEYQSKSEADKLTYGIWKDEYDSYADSVKYMEFQQAQIDKDRAYYKTEVEPAFQSFLKALGKAQEPVTKAVNGIGFKMNLTGDDAYELPKQEISTGSVVEAFKTAVGLNLYVGSNNYIKVDDGKLAVAANDQDKIEPKIFGDVENPENASLAGIIDALQREMVITDQYVKDTAGIGALVAATLADYKATKATLVAGRDAYKPYVDAKAAYAATQKEASEKAKAASESIDYLLKAIKGAQKQQDGEAKWDLTKGMQDSIETGIINFGKAVYDYFGKVERDSVVTYVFDSKTSEEVVKKVALKDLTKDDFDPFKTTNPGFWRTIFISNEYAINNGYDDPYNAVFASYNNILKSINGITEKEIVKWWQGVNDGNIRSFSDETVAMWGITTRPAKATDAKTYKYVAADKTFKSDNVEFNYNGLNDKNTAVTTAYNNFYTKIYEHFWGVKFNTTADSLVINFNEKTYTDPYLLPDFTKDAGFFTPSKKGAGSIDWGLVGLEENHELDVINEQLKQTSNGHEVNNLEVKKNGTRVDWTLYAKVLATAQFENEAKYYVENKEALEELAEIVEDVEDVYAEACETIEEKQALADSLVTEYVGADVIKNLLAKDKIDNAADLWNSTLRPHYIIPLNLTQETFKSQEWIKDGEYDFSGYQLEAAEAILGDYAARINDWSVKETQIDADTQYCNKLKGYLDTYVKALYKYKEGQNTSGNPDEVYQYLQTVWTSMINGLRADITVQEEKIETAKHALAKIEAGFDDQQIAIEAAQVALAKAQAALEVAEANLKVAEVAYKAVLAAHGITE